MKNISTLVKDIYSLFTQDDGVVVSKEVARELADQAGANIADHIYNSVYEVRKLKTNLRLSQIGKPLRQIWYSSKGVKGEGIDGPTYIKFLYGNILEELLVALSELSGHKVTESQKEIDLDDIKGHQDARVDGVLVDFKSASHYAFSKFGMDDLSKRDPFGYIYQLAAYAKSKRDKIASWVVINKQTGEIAVSNLHELEMPDVSEKIRQVKHAVGEDSPPPRCYDDIPDGKSGNRRLDFGCVYCVYKLHCWSHVNNGKGLRKFNYSNGPKYFTQISKMPIVEEEHLIAS
jgi:hypothetical protein|tara:strand:- start:785 stop:1651 length:867 start_codon:yes stop_codon:yes gene_type:complete